MPKPATLDAALMYAATFAARQDAYSLWTGDTWRAIRMPLTPEVILEAFSTKMPVSGYMLGPDSRSQIVALDIDREDGLSLGKQFAARLNELGGVCYVEASRRGCHVWTLLDKPMPGVLLRRALKGLMHEAGLPEDPKIELRPGSDRLSGEEALGHCLRMPTMPHPATKQRYVLVSSDGEILPTKLIEMMLEIRETRSEIFNEAAGRAPLPPPSQPPAGLRYPFGFPEGHESASDILRDLWGVQNAQPGHAVICPAHPDHRPSLSILRDDQRAICKVPGCDLNNNDRGRGTHELRAMAPAGGRR